MMVYHTPTTRNTESWSGHRQPTPVAGSLGPLPENAMTGRKRQLPKTIAQNAYDMLFSDYRFILGDERASESHLGQI